MRLGGLKKFFSRDTDKKEEKPSVPQGMPEMM